MSRRQSRSNAIVAALKSMVAGQRALSGGTLRGRNIRQFRSQRCAAQSEVFETRVLLTRLSVGPNVNVSPLAGNQDESAIVVNPKNPMQLFAMSNNAAGGLMAARSIDGGATWLTSNGSDALIADGNDGLVAACCDPTIAWDTFGNLYISYISSDLQSIPIAISTDGGALFSQLTSITGGNVDQPTVNTGPGQGGLGQALWITYDQGGTQARGAAVTGLGAANVGALGAAQAVTGVNQFGDIAIGPSGQVTVTGQNATQIQVNTDPDGLGPLGFSGAVIATTTNVDTFDAIPSQPSRSIDAEAGLAYDRSGGALNGRLYLIYTDEVVDENDDTEIYVRTSSDNGATWSSRVRVNDDTTTNSQWFGKIAVDQTSGDIGVTWYDARNSATNRTVQLWGSISSDGGATWDANTRISAGTINGTVPATGGQQLGDYIGLTFDSGVLHPSWSDNSNSTGNNPDGTLRQLDIYTAAVRSAVATMTVTPASIREDAGASAATITIRRGSTSNAADLVLDLLFDDPSEVALPSLGGGTQVTIPAGQNQIVIPVDAVDDTLLDGTQTVTFDLQFNGASIITATLQVTDVEALTIAVDPASIREDAGAGAGTVTVTRGNTDTFPPDTYAVVNNELLRHDYLGNLVSTRSIPWPTGARPAGQMAHDLVMLSNGRVAVYNGTSIGYVSVFNPANNAWQHFFISGLSTDAGDVATGGITSWGNYVFVSDMESAPGNAFGAVRLDLTTGTSTRFATQSLGYRMFVKDTVDTNIIEIDPATGATVNSIPMPISNSFGYNTGMAFDGTFLWLLAGGIGNDQVYQMDPDTGAVIDIHHLGGTSEWDGLGWVNGLLYAQDNFLQNQISVYDPAQRRVIRTLDVGTLNNINITGGLAGITGPDRLIATSTFGDEIYEINPTTGIVTNRWNSGMSSTEYGVGTAAGEIYIGEHPGGQLKVFNRSGVFQRFVDVNLTLPEGVFAIGGDDVPGLTTTTYRYRDIYAGLDDQLYVLDVAGTAVGKYDPSTLALDKFFNVAQPVNALAVAADGSIWGAGKDGTLYHFSSTGALLGSLVTGVAELIDIDLNITGQILLTGRDGTVLKTSSSMIPITSFSTGSLPAFITLGRHQTLPAGDVIVQLINSDPTEVSIPSQVIIPFGQQSVTVPLDAVDDNILDGTQTVTITATALGYTDVPFDTIDVLDAETVGVDIIATEISEAAGNGATQARVFRTDVDGPFAYKSKQSGSNTTSQTILDFDKITSKIVVPSQTSRLTDVNVTLSLKHSWLADLDIYLVSPAGTRIELVTDLADSEPFLTNTTFDDEAFGSILAGTSPYTGKFRPEGSLLNLIGENPSGEWTLEITDDNQSDFGTLFSWSLDLATSGLAPQVVTLSLTGDPGEISVQQTVTIPANQSQILIPVNAVDDTLLDGTQVAGIQAGGSALGFEFGSDNVNVLDQEVLTLSVSRTSVSEAAGPNALTGTLTRFNTDRSLPFTVSLSSSDVSELTVPANVTIPAGASFVTFPINAIDDAIVDGPQSVVITVSAPAYGANISKTVIVEDLEPSLLLTTSTPVVGEDFGSIQVTVTRLDQSNISLPMVVNLSTSNVPAGGTPTLSVPPTVTIGANLISATFTVTVNDDNLLDGTQTGQLNASSAGIIPGSLQIQVTDHESLTVTVDKSEFLENAGAKAARGTVRRSNTNISQALIVTLTSNDLTELTVPASVTIPAGASSVSFDVAAINDPILDGPQLVSIAASAAGYFGGAAPVTVLDHEPPVITAPGSTTVEPRPVIRWNAITGATRYEVWISNLSTGVNAFVYDVNVTGNSYTPHENLGIGRYRVWVRAVDSLERAGFWSVGRDFKVETAPLITAPIVTGTIASAVFPEIAWTAVADAARYELWVNNLTTGQTRVIGRTNLTTTSYRSTEGLGSGTYRAYVRAFNSVSEFGLWSPALTFTVLAAPGIIQPGAGGTFNRTPLFTWNAIPGASNYDLWVSSITTNSIVIRNKSVLGTSFRASADFATGDYQVWVRAQSGVYFSNWSAVRLFSVGTPPKISSPTNNSTVGNRPEFNWSGISGTERYELWVTNLTTNVRSLYITNLTATTFTPATALSAGKYRVWVRAVSTMGETTDWSKSVDFTVASVFRSEDQIGGAPVLESLMTAITAEQTQYSVSIKMDNRDRDPGTPSETGARSSDAAVTSDSGSDVSTTAEIDAAFDSLMNGWDVSEWWNMEQAAVPVPGVAVESRRSRRHSGVVQI